MHSRGRRYINLVKKHTSPVTMLGSHRYVSWRCVTIMNIYRCRCIVCLSPPKYLVLTTSKFQYESTFTQILSPYIGNILYVLASYLFLSFIPLRVSLVSFLPSAPSVITCLFYSSLPLCTFPRVSLHQSTPLCVDQHALFPQKWISQTIFICIYDLEIT